MRRWLGFLLAVAACASPTPTHVPAVTRTPARPVAVDTGAVALARTRDGLVVTLPPSSLPPGATVDDDVALTAAPTQRGDAWGWPLPFDPSLVATPQTGARTFGFYPPASMTLRVDGVELPFERLAGKPGSWGYDAEMLWVRTSSGDAPRAVVVHFPRAAAAERGFHFAMSGATAQDFVLRDVVQGHEARRGLHLPAPATATWTIQVPAGAPELRFDASLLRGALRRHETDGATLTGSVVTDHGEVPLGHVALTLGPPVRTAWPLSAYAGQRIQLRLSTQPGATATADHVFLADPVVVAPSPSPRRIVALFLDTVRRDALGAYGRPAFPATPKLDAWATAAMRFDDARTVAPWTLPSARAALTGAEPEAWRTRPTLPDRLAGQGWVTEGLVANAFLSPAFDGHRGFGHYAFHHLQQADQTVDEALSLLAEHPDRDVFLWLQFMEAHLPYRAPERYAGTFAGSPPASLKELSKARLDRLSPDDPEFDAIRDHVRARYAEQLRFLDDAIGRLLGALGPDATIVVFSDHGEEFWDHGGFEHGHAFGDELLRVPFLLYDRRLPAGSSPIPASLADLTPTLLELAGVPMQAPLGRSLVGPLFAEADPWWDARVRTFGRPLYGDDGWGYVDDDLKWWTRNGQDHEVDLAADPREATPRAVSDPQRAAVLAKALTSRVVRALRVDLPQGRDAQPDEATLRVPGGVAHAWPAYDPRSLSDGVTITVRGEAVTVAAPADRSLPAAVYLVPNAPIADLRDLRVALTGTHVGTSVRRSHGSAPTAAARPAAPATARRASRSRKRGPSPPSAKPSAPTPRGR